MLREKILWRFK